MDSEFLQNVINKASFELGMSEITISSDGITGEIKCMSPKRDRLAHIKFPFELAGEWTLRDARKIVTSLKKMKGEVEVSEISGALKISKGKKWFKFPVQDAANGIFICPFIPKRDGLEIYFGSKMYAEADFVFTPEKGEFVRIVTSEKMFKETCVCKFTNEGMEINAADSVDFGAGDFVPGTYENGFDSEVSASFSELIDLAKVLTGEIKILCGNGMAFYLEEIDGDINSTFVIMPIRAVPV